MTIEQLAAGDSREPYDRGADAPVADILPHPDAPAGAVTTLAAYFTTTFPPGSAVLCRNNAPLVTHAFAAIRRGIPVRILGRELGQGLTKVIKSFKTDDAAAALEALGSWYHRQVKKVKRPAQRAVLDDKMSCLCAVLRECRTVADAEDKINRLFVNTSEASCLTLATGHKAKGQEWDHVFILDAGLIPSRWAESQDELTQERNLLYVMVTRARLTLTYIKSDSWQ